jgi:hypothetical protein
VSPARRQGAAPAVVLVVAVALGMTLRLTRGAVEPSTFDEVSFLTALERWDLLAFEPHFPGYPLAVLLARAAAALGAPAPYAAAAAALLVPAAFGLFVALGRTWGGAVAGGLLALAPLAVSEGARPMADSTATALLALGLVAAARATTGGAGLALAAGALLGLAAAAKPDLGLFLHAAPLAAWVAPGPGRGGRVALSLAGAGAVLLAAALGLAEGAGGPAALVHEAARFTRGHATEWGGGVTTAAAPLGLVRPLRAFAPLVGLSSVPLLLLVAMPLALLARHAPRGLRRAAVFAVVPYTLWHLLGQNLEHARHALPLLVPLAVLVGAGVDRLRASRAAPVAAGLLLAAGLGAALSRPDDAFERLLADLRATDRANLRVYGGASIRPLRWRLPDLDARRARDVDHALADLAADPCPPDRAWILKEVPGSSPLPVAVEAASAALHVLVPGEPHGR